MKKLKKPLLYSIFYILYSLNNVAFAQGRFLTCSGPDCDLCDLLALFKNLITFGLELGVVIAGLFIAWGAFVIMTARDSEEQFKKGREIMTIAVYGVAIALASWLIVGTTLQILTGSPSKLPWDQIQCTF